jgi:hypothetical protein
MNNELETFGSEWPIETLCACVCVCAFFMTLCHNFRRLFLWSLGVKNFTS